jgi:RHS repeat-associated protein
LHWGCGRYSYDVASEQIDYNYFRYYDPSLGRYITSDRIGLADGPNTYAYVGGNPLTYFDPDGERKFIEIFRTNSSHAQEILS